MYGATHFVGIGADVERSEAWCFTLAKTGVCDFYAEYIVIQKNNSKEVLCSYLESSTYFVLFSCSVAFSI